MDAPFIVIDTYAIKEGQLEGFRKLLRELFEVLEANGHRLLALNAYLSDDGTEASIVQIHPDGVSIRDYWRLVHQHTGRAFGQFVDPIGFQAYGGPSDLVQRRAGQHADSGVAVSVKPEHLGGFTRLAAAAA